MKDIYNQMLEINKDMLLVKQLIYHNHFNHLNMLIFYLYHIVLVY